MPRSNAHPNESPRRRGVDRSAARVLLVPRAPLREQLAVYRIERNLPLRKLADLIGGISYQTLCNFLRGGAISDRLAFKVKTFLTEVGRAA